MTADPLIADRHLANALTWYLGLFTTREWPAGSWQAGYLAELYERRFDHPHVRTRAAIAQQSETMQGTMLQMIGGPDALRRLTTIGRYDANDVDPGQDSIFLHHIDEGAERDDHYGWLPSEMLTVGCNVLGQRGAELRQWAIARARQLYRDGFYADPFSNEPRRRAA